MTDDEVVPPPAASPATSVAPPAPATVAVRPGRGAWFGRPLVVLSLICLASFLCEGVAGDWSSLYLREVTGASAGIAGLGFVAFTVAMLAARLVGDRVIGAVGAGRVIRPAAATASVAFVVVVAIGGGRAGTAAAVVGFGILGAGVGCVVPTTISAAGRLGAGIGGPSTGDAVAAVVGTGYLGWLAGPPLVGGLAELVSLRVALLAVAVLTALIAVLAPALSR